MSLVSKWSYKETSKSESERWTSREISRLLTNTVLKLENASHTWFIAFCLLEMVESFFHTMNCKLLNMMVDRSLQSGSSNKQRVHQTLLIKYCSLQCTDRKLLDCNQKTVGFKRNVWAVDHFWFYVWFKTHCWIVEKFVEFNYSCKIENLWILYCSLKTVEIVVKLILFAWSNTILLKPIWLLIKFYSEIWVNPSSVCCQHCEFNIANAIYFMQFVEIVQVTPIPEHIIWNLLRQFFEISWCNLLKFVNAICWNLLTQFADAIC
jgi:hypothetical protein